MIQLLPPAKNRRGHDASNATIARISSGRVRIGLRMEGNRFANFGQ